MDFKRPMQYLINAVMFLCLFVIAVFCLSIQYEYIAQLALWSMLKKNLKKGSQVGYFYERSMKLVTENSFLIPFSLSIFVLFLKGFEDVKAVAFACVFCDKFLLMPHLVQPI